MSKNQAYKHQVFNDSGYILMFPNLGEDADLLQSYPPNPYAESATQLYPLGTKLIQGERVWRYCKNGAAALAIAGLVQSPAVAHAEQNYNIACGAVAAIGAYEVVITSTANLDTTPNDEKNSFAEGYLFVNDEAGEGQCYKIKSNDALSGTGNSTFVLYDPLTIALSTSSQLGLIHNLYDRVIIAAAVTSGHVIGVPLIAVSTASYYFWCQTGGPAPVWNNGTEVLGTMVTIGTTAGKGDPMAAVTTELIIGYPLTPCETATETFMCFLTLDN